VTIRRHAVYPEAGFERKDREKKGRVANIKMGKKNKSGQPKARKSGVLTETVDGG